MNLYVSRILQNAHGTVEAWAMERITIRVAYEAVRQNLEELDELGACEKCVEAARNIIRLYLGAFEFLIDCYQSHPSTTKTISLAKTAS